MPEEPRFFIRIALYAVIAGTIYWFVSYEDAGTALFGFLATGCLFFAFTAASLVRARRVESLTAGGPLSTIDRLIGFRDDPDEDANPLELEPEPISPASTWPLVAASAMLLIALGLIYGAWFWLPGTALAGAAAWGWTTELTR